MHGRSRPTRRALLSLAILLTISCSLVETVPLSTKQDDPAPTTNISASHLSGKPKPKPQPTTTTTTTDIIILSKSQTSPEEIGRLEHWRNDSSAVDGVQAKADKAETSHNKTLEPKVEIDPSFFYDDKGLVVRCIDPKFVYGIVPWESTEYPAVKLEDWTDWAQYETRKVAEKVIKGRQATCYACACDEDGKVTTSTKRDCVKPERAQHCIIALGCICTVQLTQPYPIAGASLDDYQRALDAIPLTARLRNRDYRWLYNGGSLGFSPDAFGLQLANEHQDSNSRPTGRPRFFDGQPGGVRDVFPIREGTSADRELIPYFLPGREPREPDPMRPAWWHNPKDWGDPKDPWDQ